MPDLPLTIPQGCPVPPAWPPSEDWWELIVVALSNGKDSRVVLHDALDRYPRRRIVALYNHLGNEHEGSEAEAAALCRALEVPLLFTWKERRDGRLVSRYGPEVPAAAANLDLVVELAAARGQWADRANPLCTSTGKRETSDVVLRAGCLEMPGAIPASDARRILFLSGERAEESAARARRPAWSVREGATSPAKGRLVLWHRPVHDWPEQQVWDFLARHDSPAMPASYAQGFSRHSCWMCIHRTWPEACLAFAQAPGPAALRVAVEERIGHKVNLRYFLCSCGCTRVSRSGRALSCADCGRPAAEGNRGFRAVWEFVYGPWRGIPGKRPGPRAEAIAAIDRWRGDGTLFQLSRFLWKNGDCVTAAVPADEQCP
jgi:3'-phosphoadenosine 5'-phosphosulfate sulfotransferase (PAPS reductase)/FAD synthetase